MDTNIGKLITYYWMKEDTEHLSVKRENIRRGLIQLEFTY